jgi:AraC-like DNA-binding protein
MIQVAEPIVGERARLAVASALEAFLAGGGVGLVHVSRGSIEPPMLAYLTHFPRLTVVLSGTHTMSVAEGDRSTVIRPAVGGVVFVPENGWNLPDWSEPVRGLTFLFGKQHVGVSLVDHPGGGPEVAPQILKTSVPRDLILQHLLDGLSAVAELAPADDDAGDDGPASGGLLRSVTSAVLHAGLRILTVPPSGTTHRARRLCEAMRLYIQENAHLPITRESVAAHFGMTPNHVSRLFRQEGELGFNQLLNAARIDRAKYLLGEYGTPLKEVARHCGFATTAYFCRTFKSLTARTPTEYRLAVPRAKAAAGGE